MSKHHAERITLIAVTEELIEPLVALARQESVPNEVSPDFDGGNTWTEDRLAWVREFHLGSEPVLREPRTYKTWVVYEQDAMRGSVRLALLDHPRVAETGLWIARSRRRSHVGLGAMEALIEVAQGLGIGTLIANTTRANAGALAMLERLGATLAESEGEAIQARMRLVGP